MTRLLDDQYLNKNLFYIFSHLKTYLNKSKYHHVHQTRQIKNYYCQCLVRELLHLTLYVSSLKVTQLLPCISQNEYFSFSFRLSPFFVCFYVIGCAQPRRGGIKSWKLCPELRRVKDKLKFVS